MDLMWGLLIISLISFINAQECGPHATCLHWIRCRLKSTSVVFPCGGSDMVCCPNPPNLVSTVNTTAPVNLEEKIKSIYPQSCGLVSSGDRIISGTNASIGQFPWMALLGYKVKSLNITQFNCGGSVISDRHILTAAHCIYIQRHLELVLVRLGELDLKTEIDCMKNALNKTVCADPYKEYLVDRLIVHENFDKEKLINDIALVRVKTKIVYTNYIKAICLPFPLNLRKQNFAERILYVSGWGKTDPLNAGGSQILQYAPVRAWNQSVCNEEVPPLVRPLKHSQICANGDKTEDACKGDSGGPLINITTDEEKELRYYQIGIVSHATADICGNNKIPTVYTRVDSYLDWILEHV